MNIESLSLGAGPAILIIAMYGAMALVIFLESVSPKRNDNEFLIARWSSNIGITILNQVMLLAIGPGIALLVSYLIAGSYVGLLARLEESPILQFVLTFFCLELAGYWMHRLFHVNPLLWRLHAVHHSDINIDATSSHRHHPGEVLIIFFVDILLLTILAPLPVVVFWCSFLRVIQVAFSHGNIRTGRLEFWLRYLIVTPDYHRIHHAANLPFTNTNYSSFLPWFDYIFGTHANWTETQQVSMPLGLEYFRGKRDQRVDQLFLQPLKYRPQLRVT